MNEPEKKIEFKDLIKRDAVKEKFEQMMGGKGATAFLLSVLNCVQNNDKLQQADPNSVLMAAAVAGTLNLPVDPSLGMAYITPYKTKGVYVAQFQIGYKGLIELGHRSQQYQIINVSDVRDGEYKGVDRLTGKMDFNWMQDNDERNEIDVIGYVAFFKLNNGFTKLLYMTNKEIDSHAKKYSKTYSFSEGSWNTNRPGMSKKTVLKLLIDKYGPKSVEMMKAIKSDQAIVGDYDGNRLQYIDNPDDKVIDLDELNRQKERQRVINHIENSKTVEMLEQCYEAIPDDQTRELYDAKMNQLKTNSK